MSQVKTEAGLKRMQEILGPEEAAMLVKKFKGISEDFTQYVFDFVYGDIYSRKGIGDTMREVAAVTSLISQGNTGVLLKAHMRAMLNVGHTQKDIIELLLFLTPCVGFPSIVEAFMIAGDLFQETP